ncbi:MAG: hypothetical protein ACJA2O_004657 [Candidatus Azotimanducaceae bacterium]|jgi:hypothetical protein
MPNISATFEAVDAEITFLELKAELDIRLF